MGRSGEELRSKREKERKGRTVEEKVLCVCIYKKSVKSEIKSFIKTSKVKESTLTPVRSLFLGGSGEVGRYRRTGHSCTPRTLARPSDPS